MNIRGFDNSRRFLAYTFLLLATMVILTACGPADQGIPEGPVDIAAAPQEGETPSPTPEPATAQPPTATPDPTPTPNLTPLPTVCLSGVNPGVDDLCFQPEHPTPAKYPGLSQPLAQIAEEAEEAEAAAQAQAQESGGSDAAPVPVTWVDVRVHPDSGSREEADAIAQFITDNGGHYTLETNSEGYYWFFARIPATLLGPLHMREDVIDISLQASDYLD